jgi:TetR/AcrR family transcriptional regulator, cholesterol catabolism regulator
MARDTSVNKAIDSDALAGASSESGNGTADKAPQSRRAEILDLAAQLFAEQGVDKTTVREIGKVAGMLSGSLYHYFDSKESIVGEIVTGYLAKRLADCERIVADYSDPRDRLAELLRSELRDIADSNAARVVNSQSRYVLRLLPTNSSMRELAVAVRAIWIETIRTGVQQGVFRDDVDIEIFYALARKTSSIAQQWVDGLSEAPKPVTTRWSTDSVAEAWISVLLNGFESRPV